MATSTRDDIAARVKLRLRVKPLDEMDSDPFSLQRIIDEVANDVSRKTRISMRRFTADIAGTTDSPQESVCVPELYEIISLLATLGTDNTASKRLLRQVGIEEADRYMQEWRENPASGFPRFYIYAPPKVYLYPQPDYACTGGLVFEGYASPIAAWPSGTDVPKVPERVIDTIVYGAAARWGMEYPEIPNVAQRAATFGALYDERIGELEAEVNRQADRARDERHGLY